MNTASQLVTGYTAYTDARELGASATAQAPGTSPIIVFSAASSTECAAFTASVVSAGVGASVNWGC